jgi:hypothetical protein
MNKNLIVGVCALAVTAIGGLGVFNVLNTDEFNAQTGFKSYSYEQTFAMLNTYTDTKFKANFASPAFKQSYDDELKKLYANKTLRFADDGYYVRNSLYSNKPNAIKLNGSMLKFTPSEYNCSYNTLEFFESLQCIMFVNKYSLTTNYGGFEEQFNKYMIGVNEAANVNSKEWAFLNKYVNAKSPYFKQLKELGQKYKTMTEVI